MSTLKLRATGNRHHSAYSMSMFLRAAFGDDHVVLKTLAGKRLRSRTAAAVALQASPTTISTMRCVVAGSVMARQAHLLSQLYKLCIYQPPLFAGTRTCFDETSQVVVAGSSNRGKAEKGAHQIMVVKKTLCLVWADQHGQLSTFQVPLATQTRAYRIIVIVTIADCC